MNLLLNLFKSYSKDQVHKIVIYTYTDLIKQETKDLAVDKKSF